MLPSLSDAQRENRSMPGRRSASGRLSLSAFVNHSAATPRFTAPIVPWPPLKGAAAADRPAQPHGKSGSWSVGAPLTKRPPSRTRTGDLLITNQQVVWPTDWPTNAFFKDATVWH